MKRKPTGRKPLQRGGVSIIEVTFSIGVVIVGVLGVVTLLPLAHRQAEKGISSDRAATIASSAEEAFRLQGMASIDSWRIVDGYGAAGAPSIPRSVFPLNGVLTADRENLDYRGFRLAGLTYARLRRGLWPAPVPPGGGQPGAPYVIPGNQTPLPVFEKEYPALDSTTGKWIWTKISEQNPVAFNTRVDPASGMPQFFIPIGHGFCIDGRFVSLVGNHLRQGRLRTEPNAGGQTQLVNVPAFGRYFPYTPEQPGTSNRSITVRLHRIGLRAIPNAAPQIMSLLQTEAAFVSQNDLAFSRPESDATLPPVQTGLDPGPDGEWGVAGFDDNNNNIIDDSGEAGAPGSDDSVYQRQYTGSFSWMAVLMPKIGRVNQTAADVYESAYTLSVVVFKDRSVTMTTPGQDGFRGAAGQDDDNNGRIDDIGDAGGGDDEIDMTSERSVHVAFVYTGVNTTEALLQARPGRPKTDLDIKVGQWFMATGWVGGAANSGLQPFSNGSPAYGVQVAKWYRVTAVGELEVNNGWQRRVSIAGPDWNINHFAQVWPVSGVNARIAEGVIMPSVVNVHVRTVRLERSSLWSIDRDDWEQTRRDNWIVPRP